MTDLIKCPKCGVMSKPKCSVCGADLTLEEFVYGNNICDMCSEAKKYEF